MNKDYESALLTIRKARADYRPTGMSLALSVFIALLLLMYGDGLYIESVTILGIILVLGALAITLNAKEIREIAHLPCPRCGEAFGSSKKHPIGWGADVCQNCSLHLYLGAD